MPVSIQCPDDFPLTATNATQLWRAVRGARHFNDDIVTIRCVDEDEIRKLNNQYRGKDAPTNVLTFSYDGEHDIALCMTVAKSEAASRDVELRDYTALLLTHALLHAADMDHEKSEAEEAAMQQLEQDILDSCGFSKISLQ